MEMSDQEYAYLSVLCISYKPIHSGLVAFDTLLLKLLVRYPPCIIKYGFILYKIYSLSTFTIQVNVYRLCHLI